MVSTSGCQSEYTGSIPVTRSNNRSSPSGLFLFCVNLLLYDFAVFLKKWYNIIMKILLIKIINYLKKTMKPSCKNSMVNTLVISLVFIMFGLIGPAATLAATTPSLGLAATYGVLGSTYTNTTAGTTINGDVGFTTGPAVAPLGTHANYGSGVPYATAGLDQGSALSALASEACTFTFGGGAINLSTDTTHGTAGVYTPGVYCGSGAMDVGGPLTLNGSGTYIFRSGGALTTTAGAIVTLSGASACDVFWTPSAATTLAANTAFVGTVISDAGITVGSTVTWTGRALSFGGTTTTDTDTITVPTCAAAPAPAPAPAPALATLHVVKQVVNNNGGTATASLFNLHVKLSGADVAGSPAVGIATPGTFYSLSAGTYAVSEDANGSYTKIFSGDCDSSGNITLISGDNKTCIITNTDIAVVPTPTPTPTPTPAPAPALEPTPAPVPAPEPTFAPEPELVPLLPATGIGPDGNNSAPWNIIVPAGVFAILLSFYLTRKKWAI